MWNCCKSNRLKCRASIKTRGNIIIMQRHKHNHSVDAHQDKYYQWIKGHFFSWYFVAEDNWSIDDVVLKENEILINKPFLSLVGANNSQIVEDEYGFKYRKQYAVKKEKDAIMWKCCKINTLNCKATIKTRGGIIIKQRHTHNHDVDAYVDMFYRWIKKADFFQSCRMQLECDKPLCERKRDFAQ